MTLLSCMCLRLQAVTARPTTTSAWPRVPVQLPRTHGQTPAATAQSATAAACSRLPASARAPVSTPQFVPPMARFTPMRAWHAATVQQWWVRWPPAPARLPSQPQDQSTPQLAPTARHQASLHQSPPSRLEQQLQLGQGQRQEQQQQVVQGQHQEVPARVCCGPATPASPLASWASAVGVQWCMSRCVARMPSGTPTPALQAVRGWASPWCGPMATATAS